MIQRELVKWEKVITWKITKTAATIIIKTDRLIAEWLGGNSKWRDNKKNYKNLKVGQNETKNNERK